MSVLTLKTLYSVPTMISVYHSSTAAGSRAIAFVSIEQEIGVGNVHERNPALKRLWVEDVIQLTLGCTTSNDARIDNHVPSGNGYSYPLQTRAWIQEIVQLKGT